ncbi:PilW family protein [Rheinheimera marina]|uniref:PilW family protein n=1 Tax=Rheinheimera marina TaxID=1774958 RepID=A0ABV9JRF1_9GAMM
MRRSKPKGFTLIEVLIAATILFMVIAAVSQVYRAASVSSEKASAAVDASALVDLLTETVSFRLRTADVNKVLEQEGVLNGYRFSWRASVSKRAAPAPRYELESDSFIRQNERFYLWQVELTLIKNEKQQRYQFNALSWGLP